MAYSYGGWQDEFKGLTKETDFRGSAPSGFNEEEEVQDIRPPMRPRNTFAPPKRPTPGLGAKDETVDDTEQSDDSITGVFKNIMNNTDPLVAPSASNLSTERQTQLYLAQKEKRNKNTASYLDNLSQSYVPLEMKSDQEPETFLVSDYYNTLVNDLLIKQSSIDVTSSASADEYFDLDKQIGELYKKVNDARKEEELQRASGEIPKKVRSDFKLDLKTGRKYDASFGGIKKLSRNVEGLLRTKSFVDREGKYYGRELGEYDASVPYGLDMPTRIKLGALPPLSDDLDPVTGKYVGGKPTSGVVILNDQDEVIWSQKEGLVEDTLKEYLVELVGEPTINLINQVANIFSVAAKRKEDFDKLQGMLGPEVDLELVMRNIEDRKTSLAGLY